MGLFNPQAVNGVNTSFMRLGSENQIDLASKINSLFNEPLRREAAQQALFGNQLQNTIQAEAFRQSLENYPLHQRLAQLNLQDAERKAIMQPQLDKVTLAAYDLLMQQAEKQSKDQAKTPAGQTVQKTIENPEAPNINTTVVNPSPTELVSLDQVDTKWGYDNGMGLAAMTYNKLTPEAVQSLQDISKAVGYEDMGTILALKAMESGDKWDFTLGQHGTSSSARGQFGLTDGYRADFFDKGKGKAMFEQFKTNNKEAYEKAVKAFGGNDDFIKDIFTIRAAQLDGGYGMGEPTSLAGAFKNIYFGHLLGAQGGRNFLAGYNELGTNEKRSNTPISALVSQDAIKANPAMFTGKDGKLLSVQQFYNKVASKADGVQEGLKKALNIFYNDGISNPSPGTSREATWGNIKKQENNNKIATKATMTNGELLSASPEDKAVAREYATGISTTASLLGDNKDGKLDVFSNVSALVGVPHTYIQKSGLQHIPSFQKFAQSQNIDELNENFDAMKEDEAIGKALGDSDQGVLLPLYLGMKSYFNINMNSARAFTMTSFDKDNVRVFSKPALEKFSTMYTKLSQEHSANAIAGSKNKKLVTGNLFEEPEVTNTLNKVLKSVGGLKGYNEMFYGQD